MKKSINNYKNLVDYFTDGKYSIINNDNEYVARSGKVTNPKFTKSKGEAFWGEKEDTEELKNILEIEYNIKDLKIIQL